MTESEVVEKYWRRAVLSGLADCNDSACLKGLGKNMQFFLLRIALWNRKHIREIRKEFDVYLQSKAGRGLSCNYRIPYWEHMGGLMQ